MNRLQDYIEIDKRFQSSINLQLDIDNDSKIESYIPTRSSLAILRKYIDAVEQDENDKATILIGPYGKGKSHLLLVLLRILSNPNTQIIRKLLTKMKRVDADTAALIETYVKEKKKFLPVIISSSVMNLGESFILGLTEALQDAGLNNIAPDSYYSEAKKAIDGWKKHYPDTYHQFVQLAEAETGQTMQHFLGRLEAMKEDALNIFRKLYPKVTAGSTFQPIVNMEIMKVYEGVNRVLCEKHGYAGIFIVFDEFSKYIEGHELETFSRDIKILQDMCELAAKRTGEQVHIAFIAHKNVKEYGNQLPQKIQNDFAAIEERLTQIPFMVSAKNNFELVMDAIHKKSDTYKQLSKEDENWNHILQQSAEIPCIQALFSPEEYRHIIREGCFPLLPMTVYLLLGISEKVAQNERSVFTFLSNNEPGSLIRYIENDETKAHGIGAAIVYDYFYTLFRENTGLMYVHSEWLKAEYALTKAEDEPEMQLIKTMALLKMMHNEEEIPVTEQTIWMTSGLEETVVQEKLKLMSQRQLVILRSRSKTYSFKNNIGVDLEKEIKNLVEKQNDNIQICELLEQVSELDYILPKQYNQEYTMTRYFHYEYMTSEQFVKVVDAAYLFEHLASDGKIVALIDTKNDAKAIRDKLCNLADDRILVLLPEEDMNQEKNLRRLMAVHQLQQDAEFLEANVVLEQELHLYEEDLLFEINAALEHIYSPENGCCTVIYGKTIQKKWKDAATFNRKLSEICNHYYDRTPKVNNEQINRRVITSQTRRARSQIVKDILNDADTSRYSKGTSPEATIFRATLLHTGIMEQGVAIEEGTQNVLAMIDVFIASCSGERHSFAELYEELLGQGIGARNGVIPIYIARQIAMLEGTPVITLLNKEVEIEADIFDNIDEKPESYFLLIEEQTAQKEAYLKELFTLFVKNKDYVESLNRRSRLAAITKAMKAWYRGLPQMALVFRQCPADLKQDVFQIILGLRNILRNMDINPREVLFEKIPGLFEPKDDYMQYARAIAKGKNYLDQFLHRTQQAAIAVTKRIFGAAEQDSLSSVLKYWYEEQSEEAKSYLASSQVTNFMGYLNRIHTHDDALIIGNVVKAVMDVYMEDWNDDSLRQYEEELQKLKNEIENVRKDVENRAGTHSISFTDSDGIPVQKFYEMDNEDSTSYFLKNAIEEAMEEFGDSLEVNQKVAVLVQMLEKLTK